MVTMTRKGDTVSFCPGGDIVASVCGQLKDELLEICHTGVKRLVIDLSQTKMIDSSGLGLLISTRNSLAQENNGEVEIANASEELLQLFKIMRLDSHFILPSS